MEYVRTFSREFDIGEHAVLEIESRSGAVSVRGDETRRARIEVVARIWAESDEEADDQIELIARNVRQDGPRVTIRAPSLARPSGFLGLLTRGPRIDYQLIVPRASRGQITSRSGRVEVNEIAGPLEIEARSGRVGISHISANTTIISRSGGVHVESVAGSLGIESRSGGVRVRDCRGSVNVDSRSGSIRIEEVAGDVRLKSRSGSVTVADVGGALSLQTRSGSVRYEGGVNGPFAIDITSGSVLLALDPDSVFFLDAETLSGIVRSDLPLRRSPTKGQGQPDGPTVRVRSRSGSIRIVPR